MKTTKKQKKAKKDQKKAKTDYKVPGAQSPEEFHNNLKAQTQGLFPSKSDNPEGLYRRYRVTKVDDTDGAADPRAMYFVLRIDRYGDDPFWIKSCRKALRKLSKELVGSSAHSKLGRDIRKLLKELKNESDKKDTKKDSKD